jgi:cobalamin synthase
MSKMKAIKTFRDLLAFLIIIPLGKTDDFVVTSAKAVFLFPVIGGFIGLLGVAYFIGCGFLMSYILASTDSIIRILVFLGTSMKRAGKNLFGGVSGDMIGVTNETVKAVALVFVAGVLLL